MQITMEVAKFLNYVPNPQPRKVNLFSNNEASTWILQFQKSFRQCLKDLFPQTMHHHYYFYILKDSCGFNLQQPCLIKAILLNSQIMKHFTVTVEQQHLTHRWNKIIPAPILSVNCKLATEELKALLNQRPNQASNQASNQTSDQTSDQTDQTDQAANNRPPQSF